MRKSNMTYGAGFSGLKTVNTNYLILEHTVLKVDPN